LKGALDNLSVYQSKDVLEGYETMDDAGIYRLTDDTALVQTLDFFTPIVDDPYAFGQVAVANSLSDVYAMGGVPLTAMNILCVPDDLAPERLNRVLQGGADKLREAECSLVGGHTVRDKELKFGCSITGIVHPKKFWSNATARVGDRLILTKPVGTGILTGAIKSKKLPPEAAERVTKVMATLNRAGCEAAVRVGGVSAATDITGFGLLGHLSSMGKGSHVTIRVEASRVPLIPELAEFAKAGAKTGADRTNREYVAGHYENRGVEAWRETALFDPQTSGGLLLAVDPSKVAAMVAELKKAGTLCAEVIGEVGAHEGDLHVVAVQ
jgi:selenide,water dikinase